MQRIINFVVSWSTWLTTCSDLTWLFEQEHWAARILPGATVYSKHAYHVWLCISSIHLQCGSGEEQNNLISAGLSWAVRNFKTHACFWAHFPLTGKLNDLECIYTWSITLNNCKVTVTLLKNSTYNNVVVELKSRCLHHWMTAFSSTKPLCFPSLHFWGQL